MKPKFTCYYCEHWRHGDVRHLKEGSKNTIIKRKCPKNKKWVANNDSCLRRQLVRFFWCDTYSCYLTFEQCLNRRRYARKRDNRNCSRCRQFDKELEFLVKNSEIKLPPRKIKRRKKLVTVRKQITRRKKPRKITRRKEKRVITRRDKCRRG